MKISTYVHGGQDIRKLELLEILGCQFVDKLIEQDIAKTKNEEWHVFQIISTNWMYWWWKYFEKYQKDKKEVF